jgi:hypothetical protein
VSCADGSAPSVATLTQRSGQLSPTNVSPVVFNFTGSESLVGVSAALFSTAGSTATVGAPSVTAVGALVYLVSVPVTGSGVVSLSVSAPAGVTDAAGNPLAASGATASCVFDNNRPSVSRLALAKTQAALSKLSPFVFNVSLSEPCSGLSASAFNATGSTATLSGGLTVVAVGSLVYTVSVPVSAAGSVILRVGPNFGSVVDLAGNLLLPSSLWASATFGACVAPSLACHVDVCSSSLLACR